MTSPSFPENPSSPDDLNEEKLRSWFCSGATIPQEHADENVRKFLQTRGLIHVSKKHYVKCVNEDDGDYFDLKSHQRGCDGKIYFEPGEERSKEYECDECGRTVGTVEEETLSGNIHKTHFTEYRVAPNWWGVWKLIQEQVANLPCVEDINRVRKGTKYDAFSTEVELRGGDSLRLVLADRAEVEPLHKGLFFGTPSLYVQVDPNARRDVGLLEGLQIVRISEFLTSSNEELDETVRKAATPIGNRTDFSTLSEALEQQMARKAVDHDGQEWKYFEQELVPDLINYIVEHPDRVERYLTKLKKLKDTIFSRYYVPVGGSERTDVQVVDRREMIGELLEGDFIGEAKRYDVEASTKIESDHLRDAGFHLDMSGSDAKRVVFFCTTNDVKSTVWDNVLQYRAKQGYWRFIIITRYLLLELIDALGAHELIGIEKREDGTLISIESGEPVSAVPES